MNFGAQTWKIEELISLAQQSDCPYIISTVSNEPVSLARLQPAYPTFNQTLDNYLDLRAADTQQDL